jgi:hypothetical protein
MRETANLLKLTYSGPVECGRCVKKHFTEETLRFSQTGGNDADQLHCRLVELVGVVTQQCKDDRELRALFELKMGGLQHDVADLKKIAADLVHKVDDAGSCNAALLSLIQKMTIDHTD